MDNQHPTESTRTLLLGIWGHLSSCRRIQLGLLVVVKACQWLGGARVARGGDAISGCSERPGPVVAATLVQALAARLGFTGGEPAAAAGDSGVCGRGGAGGADPAGELVVERPASGGGGL